MSRDGIRLALSTFSANADLVLLDLSTQNEARLRGLSPRGPAWAPDGHSLIFTSASVGGRFDLWIQPVRGIESAGPPRRLTDHAGSAANPAFSPDGRWVAYYRVLAGQRDIWIVPAAGGSPVQFTDNEAADLHPAWSPDGTRLAFHSERGGLARIWVAPVAGGRPAGPPKPLTTGSTADLAPAWSPDGKWIAYIATAGGNATDVWVVDADGAGRPRMLATEGSAGRVAWDHTGKALFVSGQWDSWVSLRKYALDTGERILRDPPVRLGENPDFLDFGISKDARFVAFGRDELRGDIWALESLDRPY